MPPDEQKHFNKIKLEKKNCTKIEEKQERFRIK
jgi:hypothetical protein